MNTLCISGGSTKISALAGAALHILRTGYKPDIIAGISSGAILSLPLALGLYNETEAKVKSFKLDDIFDYDPTNIWGILRGLFNIIFKGKYALGEMNQLETTIKEIVTKEKFQELKYSKTKVYVGVVDIDSTEKKYVCLNELDYEIAIAYVIASSSIPVFTPGVKINDRVYFDGGLRDHSPGSYIVDLFEKKINNHISIYSRPDKPFDIKSIRKNIVQVFMRTLDILSNEVSISDEWEERFLSKYFNINYLIIEMPKTLSSGGTYEVSNEKINEWYLIGDDTAKKLFDPFVIREKRNDV